MKTLNLKAILLTVCAIVAQFATLKAQVTIQIPAAQLKYVKPNQLPLDLKIPDAFRGRVIQQYIDLAASTINFSVARRIDQHNAVIKVEGVVKNVGRNRYESGAEQQAAYLYEDNGTGRLQLKATKVFQNLNVGEQVKVDFLVTHSKSNEFPSAYILVIGFDPDIYIDGNLKNDDANTANNRIRRVGELINNIVW